MNIQLFKYKIPASSDTLKSNYFVNAYLEYIDNMVLTNIMGGGFPIFNEEYTKEDDINVIKVGDYDLKFSLLQTEVSNLGKSIKEFLSPEDDRNFKLICGFQFDDIERWGFVDVTSIKANYTKPQNRYDVTFTVIGVLKEFMEGMKTLKLDTSTWPEGWGQWYPDPIGLQNVAFDDFMHNFLFKQFLPDLQIYLDTSQLDLDTRCGFPVLASLRLFRYLWNAGLNQGYALWSGLRNFADGLGFIIKLEFNFLDSGTWPRFKVVLLWRTVNPAIKDVSVMEDEESNALLFVTQYLFIAYNRYFPFWGTQHEGFMGLFMEKYNTYMCDRSSSPSPWPPNPDGYVLWSGGWQIFPDNDPRGDQRIPADYVTRLDLELNASEGAFGGTQPQVPVCRVLCESAYTDGKFDSIIRATAAVEYQYLLSGVKEKRDLKVSLLNNRSYKMFDSITYKDKNYWINRMQDVNLREKTAKLECIRI